MLARVRRQDVMRDGSDVRLSFRCPGCGWAHAFRIVGPQPVWQWNGSMERPTFSPSLLYSDRENRPICHSFVRDGQIQFLHDCTHKLAGQTVDLADIPAEETA